MQVLGQFIQHNLLFIYLLIYLQMKISELTEIFKITWTNKEWKERRIKIKKDITIKFFNWVNRENLIKWDITEMWKLCFNIIEDWSFEEEITKENVENLPVKYVKEIAEKISFDVEQDKKKLWTS